MAPDAIDGFEPINPQPPGTGVIIALNDTPYGLVVIRMNEPPYLLRPNATVWIQLLVN